MKKHLLRFVLLLIIGGFVCTDHAAAQKRTTRNSKKRSSAKKTTSAPTGTQVTDSSTVAVADSLPIRTVKKSLRPDAAIDMEAIKDRFPLPYENLREADAVYRHRIWREIDIREKLNLPFRYAADEDNGNQRFISILLKAVQDSAVTVFSSVDDRFTTPLTKAEVARALSGDMVDVPVYDANGNLTGTKKMANEINLDSIVLFRVKEEVIFDKESSRLFWRILGIAPVKHIISSQGVDLGNSELFWVYYPDMRPIFSKYNVYNGKNYGGRMTWEELFESRMFASHIIKSTIDNPYDLYIKDYRGLRDNGILQLYEAEDMKDKIFNYEQDLWQY